ncbi:arginine ABC transporter substrate-binding protein [Legionella taurinensis]|uniref:Arginine ABC transporter substrate-binding protein n=1 Tax=Legionella taurinensis TaxID=70611 RepID=A0A3A5L300_9GAMM|nr:transporter substrate-binding domain-containing protein [Legionella taurinensis]MDX1836304.1 transporter substrate-binding domain-containing protein [Legionella taurinensis]PUT41941.1 arginine ABC transporter substrate-binding protein [Legionella taurinensis]PUT44730.1 arginine ABC transporter substrate-binding protein [Legionella taurinensis]PUT48050.1 arginine ABC transporter substrate-binding protein [Legionella taurinensis]PUT48865.1 arginine ABC transporter substrate-binding protein [L
MRFLAKLFLVLLSVNVYAQTIRVGTGLYAPPFEMQADRQKNMYGFDIELMQEICQRAGWRCQFKGMLFEQLFTELKDNTIDLAISAISITSERQKNFLFSLPYMASGAQFLTKSQSPINTILDIRNQRVGIERGTVFKQMLQAQYQDAIDISEYATQQDVLNALSNEEIDAALIDTGAAQYWVVNNSGSFKAIGESLPVGIGYGIMANQSRQDLIATVNRQLLAMENDGAYLKLYSRYFGALRL